MKPVIMKFVGGRWDGRLLRSDSEDPEEAFLAAGCYEMSHHGSVGAECVGVSEEAAAFARHHGWEAAREAKQLEVRQQRGERYVVSERRETGEEISVTLTVRGPREGVR